MRTDLVPDHICDHCYQMRLNGYTLREIGESIGRSAERVRQIIAKHQHILSHQRVILTRDIIDAQKYPVNYTKQEAEGLLNAIKLLK